MKKWHVKAFIQKSISFLPNPEKWNFLLQKYITGKDKLSNVRFENKLRQINEHLDSYKKYNDGHLELGALKILELGTGKFPVIPIILFLKGANNLVSIDVIPFLKIEQLKSTLLKFKEYEDSKNLKEVLFDKVDARWNQLMQLVDSLDQLTVEKFCQTIGLKIEIADARETNFETNTFDLIVSNNTLEHIYPEILGGILTEFMRVLKQGGVMSHMIDMSDHFSHFDKSIDVYHFLRFSNKTWRKIDNKILPQSRLRLVDYFELYEKLNVPITECIIIRADETLAAKAELSEDFKKYTIEQLAITHARVISQK